MGKIALVAVAAFIGMLVLYPEKLQSWGSSTQDAAGSSISL